MNLLNTIYKQQQSWICRSMESSGDADQIDKKMKERKDNFTEYFENDVKTQINVVNFPFLATTTTTTHVPTKLPVATTTTTTTHGC